MHNIVKWPNILWKSCGVPTTRFLKYVCPFYNIMHERVKPKFLRNQNTSLTHFIPLASFPHRYTTSLQCRYEVVWCRFDIETTSYVYKADVFLGYRKRPEASSWANPFSQEVLEKFFTERKSGLITNCREKTPPKKWRILSHFLWLWKVMWQDFRLFFFARLLTVSLTN